MYRRLAKNKKPLRYVYVAIVGILAMALVLAIMVWQQISSAAVVRRSLIQAYEIKAVSLQVLSGLLYAETAQRGYVLTGDDDFLATYEAVRRDLLRDVNILVGSQGADAQTNKLMAALAEIAFERLEDLTVVIALRSKQGSAAATARMDTGHGQEMMLEVREVSRQLLGRQDASIKQLATRQRGSVIDIRLTIALLMLGIVVLAISTAWLIAVYLRQRDHTETQLRAGMVRQDALFQGALDALLIIDSEGRVEALNHAAQRIFSVTPNAIEGRELTSQISITYQGRALQFDEICKLAHDGGYVIELNAAHLDGKDIPVELALSKISQDGSTLYVAAFREIADRKRAQAAQREFISTVSHELRTPLTSISGALKLLTHMHGKALPADAAKLLDIAGRNAQRLGKLVNDILDIDKLETGKMVFAQVETVLEDVIDACIEAISPLASDSRIAVEFVGYTDNTVMLTDSLRLSQALTNLMANAIKFSPEGSKVVVRTALQDKRVRIEVIDQGPGIPDEFAPHLFSKFTQASTPGLMYKGGSGLGLSIVKEIVERMGGQVGFQRFSAGTVFFIDLPLSGPDLQG